MARRFGLVSVSSGALRSGGARRSWRVSVGSRRVRLVKAVEVCWGQIWSGGFRSVGARRSWCGRARSVEARQGMVRQGGRGEMCFGFIGFGIVCSRRSRCVVFGYGELR